MAGDTKFCFYDGYPSAHIIVAFDTIKTVIYVFYVIIYLRYIIIDKTYQRIHKVLYSFPLIMLANVLAILWVINT